MIIESKVDIDYERLHADRLTMAVAEQQLMGHMPSSVYAQDWRFDGASFSWRAYSAAATMDEDVRALLWFTGFTVVAITALIVICTFLFW